MHLGHLRAAQEIRDGFALECIYFILSATPPHKPSSKIVSTADRLEMLKLALSGNPDFIVSDIEALRPGPSYTIDTVDQFKKSYPSVSELFLIIGIDAFLEIETWKSYKDLFNRIPMIVMSRPPVSGNDPYDPWAHSTGFMAEQIERKLKQHIDPAYRKVYGKNMFAAPNRVPVLFKAVTPIGITSTMIRELRRKSASIRYLVPGRVAEYIEEKGLYS